MDSQCLVRRASTASWKACRLWLTLPVQLVLFADASSVLSAASQTAPYEMEIRRFMTYFHSADVKVL